jgi:hypothetical protein
MKSRSSFVVSLVLLASAWAASSAMAGCREDHIAADQGLRKARAGLEKVTGGTDGAKCSAFRRLVTALNDQRGVIARCDTGPNQSRNVQEIDTQIVSIAPQMREVCK